MCGAIIISLITRYIHTNDVMQTLKTQAAIVTHASIIEMHVHVCGGTNGVGVC